MKLIVLAALQILFCTTLVARAETKLTRPNILLFLVDDMGWQDTSVPFWTEPTPLNKRYHTPNMARLAEQGMRFTEAYACCVCSPTRVSLMTGMNAARHRVTTWTLRYTINQGPRHPNLDIPDWNYGGMCSEPDWHNTAHARPLPAILQAAGYRTIHVGKAHFGAIDTPASNPINIGFNVNIAGHAAGGPASYYGEHHFSVSGRQGKPYKPSVWDIPGLDKYHGQNINLTEALTREAIQAMDDAISDSKPFFLYMAHYAVHVPLMPDKRFLARYSNLDSREAAYASMLEAMDKSLGDLMDHLEKNEIAERTSILFMSDNGGLSAHGRGGPPHTHNRPLSSGKGSAREGGVRVPMIVKWPGVTSPNSKCEQYVVIEDFFPTILEIAGVSLPKELPQTVDGISFVPLLKQVSGYPSERALYWHFPNWWGPRGPGIGSHSAIRKGNWKLIYYHDGQQYELFNLVQDIGETKNLAEQHSDKRDRLAAQLRQYLISVKAQMPRDKNTGLTIPLNPSPQPSPRRSTKPNNPSPRQPCVEEQSPTRRCRFSRPRADILRADLPPIQTSCGSP